MSGEEVRLDRQGLYELVWSAPATKIAAEYHVSDVGLAKICRKLRVPKPGRGYWAEVAHGRRVRRPLLPAASSGRPTEVVLRKRDPSSETAAHPRAKLLVSVPEELERPHRLIRATKWVLRNSRAENLGRSNPHGEGSLAIQASPNLLPRALLLMDTLIKALEVRGHSVAAGSAEGAATTITIHGERLSVSLKERTLRTDHVPTPEERKQPAWWRPRYDWTPSGRLRFRIDDYLPGVRSSWSDGARKLEAMLGEIVLGLEEAGAFEHRERLRGEEEHRRWEEARRRAEEERVRAEHEAKRVAELRRQASDWEAAGQIRRYLQALELAVPVQERDSDLREWLSWARRAAERLDPIASVEPAAARLASLPRST